MSILKSAVKFKVAKKVTNKALGEGTISTIAAAKLTKKAMNVVKHVEQQKNKNKLNPIWIF